MKKHTSYLKRLSLMGILLILGAVLATQVRFSDSMETWFPDLNNGDASVHFKTDGNDIGGILFLRGADNMSGDGFILSGDTVTCGKKLKWLYYNSARGNRVRPLDQESLNIIRGLNSSYNYVTVNGGLYTRCTGKNPASIGGQVNVTWKGTTYKLLAGVHMSATSNTYTTTWEDNLQYTWGILSGKLFDNYGGVADVLGTGLTVIIDYTGIIIPIGPEYVNTSLGISIGNAPATITAPANTTITFDGMGDTTTVLNPAAIPLRRGSLNLSGGVMIGSTNVIPGEIVQVNSPGASLILYQAGTTNSYVQIPDNTYVIGPSGWNNVRYSPTIAGNTITFWGNTPLLFIPPIKLYFGGVSTSGTNMIPQRRNIGETTRHTITTVCNTMFGAYPTNISLTGANKECYISNGTDTIVRTHHATQYQIVPGSTPPTPSTGWTTPSGGGWGSLSKDTCKYNAQSNNNLSGANAEGIDYSPSYYDRSCIGPIIPEEEPPHEIVPVCFDYSDELNTAYDFSYSFGITTMNPCTQARMQDNLLRKDMAKMMDNFVLNVLNRQDIYQNNPDCENFIDITKETPEMTLYIQTACKLWLMGLESDGVTPQKTFNPYGVVSRAQFGTVLSRLLRGVENNVAHGSSEPYYRPHLVALNNAGIMRQISYPEMKEVRGRVFIMMNRIYNMGMEHQNQ